MVDFNLEIEKLCPINVKEIELNGQRIEDKIKKSIILYNIAIGELKEGDFLLAISDLKKAISYNKDFTEAIKIMGLCYVSISEYKKAEKIFKSLNKYKIYDDLVKEYLKSLSIRKSMYKVETLTETVEDISNNKNEQFVLAKRSSRKIVIGLLIVTFVMLGAGLKYFYPEVAKEVLTKFAISSKGIQDNSQVQNKTVDFNKERDKTPDDEKVTADKNTIDNVSFNTNSENTKLVVDNDKKENLNKLSDVEQSLNVGNYEKAAGILISMKNRNLDDDTKIKFNQLWQSLKPNPAWTIYNDGNRLYKQKKYNEALPKLVIASEIEPDLELMPWINFQIGMCYKEKNDKGNALIYFNKVKDNYPKSQYVSNAKRMISEIS